MFVFLIEELELISGFYRRRVSFTGASRHLVDVGFGYPTFEAVPLHRLPQFYNQVGLQYQFQYLDGKYARLHRNPNAADGWHEAMQFDVTARSLDYFEPLMDFVFLPNENNRFFGEIRAVRFPLEGTQLVAVVRNQLMTSKWDADDRVPIDDMLGTLTEYFPSIPITYINRAMRRLGNYNLN